MQLLWPIVALLLTACASQQAVTYKVEPPSSTQPRTDVRQAQEPVSPVPAPILPFDTPPQAISSPYPDYPASLRKANVTGKVVVSFTIGVDGTVSEPSVSGSPPPELAALAMQTIVRWKFAPAKKAGAPVAVRANQAFNFQLQ